MSCLTFVPNLMPVLHCTRASAVHQSFDWPSSQDAPAPTPGGQSSRPSTTFYSKTACMFFKSPSLTDKFISESQNASKPHTEGNWIWQDFVFFLLPCMRQAQFRNYGPALKQLLARPHFCSITLEITKIERQVHRALRPCKLQQSRKEYD